MQKIRFFAANLYRYAADVLVKESDAYYRADEVDNFRSDVQRLMAAARMVVKISDRKHDALDEIKEAMTAVDKYFPMEVVNESSNGKQ